MIKSKITDISFNIDSDDIRKCHYLNVYACVECENKSDTFYIRGAKIKKYFSFKIIGDVFSEEEKLRMNVGEQFEYLLDILDTLNLQSYIKEDKEIIIKKLYGILRSCIWTIDIE